jgi:hypothetical protein
MSALTISLALALDFLFLPTLLLKLDRKTVMGTKTATFQQISAFQQ